MATPPRGSPDSCAPPRPERFRLQGPSVRPDPRVNAYRGDLADVGLAGVLFAPHYANAVSCVSNTVAMMRDGPDALARGVSQLLPGEMFEVFDISGGWAWGRSTHDRYVGYVAANQLVAPGSPAGYRIAAIAAPLFARPDIKSAALAIWPLGARFAGTPEGDFLATAEGYVHICHSARASRHEADPVAIAERLIGQPYLWGGRGGGGIDCSGLVQVALGQCGIAAPRDSDMQREALGDVLTPDMPARRGDLVFFPGHVGMMVDEARMIHATAHVMMVTIEPLADVVARLAAHHAEPILARRRLA